VVTQFSDSSQKRASQNGEKKPDAKDAKPVFTVVRASDLVYTESSHEAVYQGGVTLERPALTVDARTLHAFLTADSTLEKAIADGAVKIVSTELSTAKEKRTRTGTAEHAEYYTAEQKVILTKGNPKVVDSVKGQTTGQELIWWADNDRFVVNGVAEQPARTRFKKK
jgi:lipopolysaccharide transport protein LptA